MDIDEIKKLSQDKIEADFPTKIGRRNIKRKEREKQDAREAFRQAFEILIESQDKTTASQNAMLDELKAIDEKLDYEMPRRRRRRRYEYESPSESDEEEDYPRPHMRIPGLISQGIANLARRGAAGAADLYRRVDEVGDDLAWRGATGAARGAVGAADLIRRGVVGAARGATNAADLAVDAADFTLEGARRLYKMLPQIRNRQQPQQPPPQQPQQPPQQAQ